MKEYIQDLLTISLGLILLLAFFKPWLPDYLYWFALTAYEPNITIRIIEGISGVVIFGFGVERTIATWSGKV